MTPRVRQPWSQDEVAATVGDYMAMLRAELTGRGYSKTQYRTMLRQRLDRRSDSAVEMKHRNISAVLDERGLRYIAGYKPLHNYQRELAEEVERTLQSDRELALRLVATG